MKHMIAHTLTSLMLVVMALTMAAHAQSTSTIVVSIPFEFNFGERTFSAGEYSLVQPIQHLIVLRDSRGHTIANALTGGIDSVTPAAETELKFDNSKGQHVLTEVWQKYAVSGARLYPAKNRTNFAKHRSTESRETAEGSQP
jgi:hypothetical protein